MTTCSRGKHLTTKISPILVSSKASLLPEKVLKLLICCNSVTFISSFYVSWIVGFLFCSFRYKSLVNFMFAAEVGMEVPLYNAAMLCEENQVRFDCFKYLKVSLVGPYNTNLLSKSKERAFIASSYCLGLLWLAIARTHSGSAKVGTRAWKIDEAGWWWGELDHHPRLRRVLPRPNFRSTRLW